MLDKCLRRIDRTKHIRAKAKVRLETGSSSSRWTHAQLKVKLRRAKRRYFAAEAKARHVVKNLHYQSSHLLLRKFKTIILPRFSAQGCTARSSRLHRWTKRRLLMLAFGKFGPRLVQTATFYPGAKILRGSEAYTSMTCGRCGHLNRKLGSSDTFSCPACIAAGNPWSMDRDVHAARNILLRFLV